jgi:adenylate cyclase
VSRSSSSSPRPRASLRRASVAAVLGLGSAAFGLAVLAGGWLATAEGITFDWREELFATPAPADLPIRLILIDDASLVGVREVYGYDWPWPREFYGRLVDRCREAGVRAIGFDLRTPLPAERPASDQAFADAMARAREAGVPVILPVLPGDEGTASVWPREAPGVFRLHGFESWRERYGDPFTLPAASFPTPVLAEAASALGHVRGSAREAAVVIRRIHPLRVFDGQPLPALGLAVWAAAAGVEEIRLGDLQLRMASRSPSRSEPPRSVPVDREGLTVLRYRRPDPDLLHLYPSLSALWVLETDDDELRAELDGRYVLLGASAAGTYDVFPSPVEPLTSGVEIHATTLDNLLSGSFLAPAPAWAVALFVVLLTFGGAAATTLLRRPGVLVPVFLLGLIAPVGAGFAAYPLGIWWPIAAPTAAAALALGVGTVVHAATEGRRRRFLLQAFGRYLSPVVVGRLVEDPSRLELGGERRELTLFFSDLEGFSTFSERLDPRELTTLLNDYLSEMTELILAEEGTLDKYEGDAILAFWNAPLDQEDHALRACRTALACQRRLAEIQDRLRGRAGTDLRMRIGIHSGPVVVGNLGSRTRFDYTVLGDAANLASRLEGANKAFGTYLMVSKATWSRVAERFVGREIGEVVVFGRQTPVRVFEPLAFAGEPKPPWLAAYREGLEHLRAGHLDNALDAFEGAGEDPVARRYAQRLREDRQSGESWDGVWRLGSK